MNKLITEVRSTHMNNCLFQSIFLILMKMKQVCMLLPHMVTEFIVKLQLLFKFFFLLQYNSVASGKNADHAVLKGPLGPL